jgi:hypothetical protein
MGEEAKFPVVARESESGVAAFATLLAAYPDALAGVSYQQLHPGADGSVLTQPACNMAF